MNLLGKLRAFLVKAKAYVIAQVKMSDRLFWLLAVLFLVGGLWIAQRYFWDIIGFFSWVLAEYGATAFVLGALAIGLIGRWVIKNILFGMWATVRPKHYGVVESYFAFRSGKVMTHGTHLKLPFFDEVVEIPLEVVSTKVTAPFNLQDDFPLVCTGALEFSPDLAVYDNEVGNRYYRLDQALICSDIEKEVKALLGELGGTTKSFKVFKAKRPAIEDILNCKMRLKTLPHTLHDPANCNVPACKKKKTRKPGAEISTKDLLEWYMNHHHDVAEMLRGESKKPAERSAIEERFGIDIIAFILDDISPSAEVNKAFAMEQEAAAAERIHKKKVQGVKELTAEGVPAAAALHSWERSMYKEQRERTSTNIIEGLDGIFEKAKNSIMGK